MAKAFLDSGINKLGTWNYKMNGEDLSTLVFYDNNGNEIPRPSDFPTDEQILTAQAEEQARLDNIPNIQASGNQKLLDLGLTQAEVTALTGYTPPVAE
jgi:hypothetical protein